MSKIIFYVLAVFLAAAVVGLPTPDKDELPEKPGYCRFGNIYIKEGEQDGAPIGECSRLKCISAEPNNKSFLAVGCGSYAPRPGCYLREDITKRYPECCPKEVCDDKADE